MSGAAMDNQETSHEGHARPAMKKHPLGQSWTLWFDNPSNKQKMDNFGETLRKIYTFETVEDFWCIQHNIALPSMLRPNCDIHLFKGGISPTWEDPKCENGGRWTINIPKSGGDRMLNDGWLDAMLACIGEMFDDMDDVCGVVCNIRNKGNRVCLWTSSANKKSLQQSMGRQLKHIMGLAVTEKISYLAHSDARKIAQSSRVADLYVV
ncbi:hypothetical protein BSKO_10561 [Bryopsis sp. KO-2023]|nr:hypothetical protein BSKO_10561 [Bryopsis sp. KO-2023]